MNAQLAHLSENPHLYRNLVTRFDARHGTMWYYMDVSPRPCVTLDLLTEGSAFTRLIAQINRTAMQSGDECPIRFIVVASRTPGVFNLGGDLDLFRRCILGRDRETLRRYALSCVDAIHMMSNNLFLPMTTISLVQGDALGGGFETALCCSVIVAERRARFSFPEILFDLFPGMGAYSLLARRIGPAKAEKLITGGAIHSAAELHEMGLVDVLAEDGQGESAVYDYIERHMRRRNAYQGLYRVRHRYHPVTLAELTDISEIWVEAAMNIGERELRLMERLFRAQDRGAGVPSASAGKTV